MLHKIPSSVSIGGLEYVGEHPFYNDITVPVFDVLSTYGLTQTVGYAKFKNKGHAKVYCRGQVGLFPSLTPSLLRQKDAKVVEASTKNLDDLIDEVLQQTDLLENLHIKVVSPDGSNDLARIQVEALLQHYGISTRFIDAVDNQWVALWFGAHRCNTHLVRGHSYALYERREIDILDALEKKRKLDFEGEEEATLDPKSMYQYMILIAADEGSGDCPTKMIDLREELPSTVLRPHAQHGVMLLRDKASGTPGFEDSVVGILRIRVDRALRWLGFGHLVSYANLFPSRVHDEGYGWLLEHQGLFKTHGCQVVDYIYDVG